MTEFMTQLARPFALSCFVSFALTCGPWAAPAQAQFNAEQMTAMQAAATVMGEGQATGDACGTDMTAMGNLIARGWKCQGASAAQIASLQALMADARKKNKVAACPTDKAAHAQQITQSTAALEAGLAKVNCKG